MIIDPLLNIHLLITFLLIPAIALLLVALSIFYLRRSKGRRTDHTTAVGEFYDKHADDFQQVYGDVIQAFRTTDVRSLLAYQAKTMQLRKGMRVLDAGCGVGGPALYFAGEYGVCVDGLTASGRQCSIAVEKIKAAGLSGQVRILQGDYHDPATFFPGEDYDVIYFLESLGHSHDKARALDGAFKVLKPGGRLYIKDLFIKETVSADHLKKIKHNIECINKAYHYNVADLNQLLSLIRGKGFILSSLKTIDIPLEEFENLSISNVFQELTGINRIDNLQSYIFPVDFFELLCIKPWGNMIMDNNHYFLQNLYYMQLEQLPKHES